MLKKQSWFIAGLLCLLVVSLVAVGCGGDKKPAAPQASAPAAPIVLKVGHNGSTDFPYHKGLEVFAKEVGEKTGGKVKIEIFPSAQLGDQRQMIEGLRLGTIDMCVTSSADMAQFVPETDVLNLPFIFRDLKHSYQVADGPIGKQLAEITEKKANVKVLAWWSSGVRSVFNSQKAIKTPEDLKGMKIRTQPNKTDVAAFNALGAIATPIAYSELYTALQQDVVKGAENDPMSYFQQKFFEVCKYYSMTEHLINGGNRPLLISMKTWAKLSDDQKKVIEAAAKVAEAYERKYFENESDKTMKMLVDKGVIVNNVDKAPFQKRMTVVWDEVGAKSPVAKQLIIDIQNTK